MRSLLLVPATASARLLDALASSADLLIVDLVAAEGPPEAARAAMTDFVRTHAGTAGRPALWVGVGDLRGGPVDADLDAAVAAGADGIVLSRAAGGADVTRLDAKIAVAEAVHGVAEGRTKIVALVTETAHAVFQAGSYRGASRRLAGMAWSTEALRSDLGAATTTGTDGLLLDAFRLARTTTLLGARAAGVAAIDAAFADVDDLSGLSAECRTAARDGFTAKLAIHPAQIAAIDAAFGPRG